MRRKSRHPTPTMSSNRATHPTPARPPTAGPFIGRETGEIGGPWVLTRYGTRRNSTILNHRPATAAPDLPQHDRGHDPPRCHPRHSLSLGPQRIHSVRPNRKRQQVRPGDAQSLAGGAHAVARCSQHPGLHFVQSVARADHLTSDPPKATHIPGGFFDPLYPPDLQKMGQTRGYTWLHFFFIFSVARAHDAI
jgi:hypothetical protein